MSQSIRKESPLLLGYAGEADIRALLELLGMVAKADAVVTPLQIQEVERFMTCQIPVSDRKLAITAFRNGKEISLVKGTVTTRAFQLYGITSDRWLEPIQVLDILLRVALADGDFSGNEEYIIDSARATLGVHKRSYWILRDTLAECYGVFIAREGASFAERASDAAGKGEAKRVSVNSRVALTRSEALSVLGLSENADSQQIKAAHRAMVKQFHPDMVEGGNASEDARKRAVINFCKIQTAYESLVA